MKTAKLRLNNGLEAYLISDPEANQSAAARIRHDGGVAYTYTVISDLYIML